MAKAVDDRGRGARLPTRDEGACCWRETERSTAGLHASAAGAKDFAVPLTSVAG